MKLWGELVSLSVHLEHDMDSRQVITDPKVDARECGHPGTQGHAFWLVIEAGGTKVDFCFHEDKAAMTRFADAIRENIEALVG